MTYVSKSVSRFQAADQPNVTEGTNTSPVEAANTSRVEAANPSRVEAANTSRVEAANTSRVEATSSSRVEAANTSRVEAANTSRVEAANPSRVEAANPSRVEAAIEAMFARPAGRSTSQRALEEALAYSMGIEPPVQVDPRGPRGPMPSAALSGAIIGAAIAVHRQLGPGLLEEVYERALMIELEYVGLRAQAQVPIALSYRGRSIGDYVADIIVEGRVVLELKAVASLSKIHLAQLMSYLRATRLRLGLLLNFNVAVLHDGVRRVAL